MEAKKTPFQQGDFPSPALNSQNQMPKIDTAANAGDHEDHVMAEVSSIFIFLSFINQIHFKNETKMFW